MVILAVKQGMKVAMEGQTSQRKGFFVDDLPSDDGKNVVASSVPRGCCFH